MAFRVGVTALALVWLLAGEASGPFGVTGIRAAGAVDYETGRAAFEAGKGQEALRAWRPLAEDGALRAQYSLGLLFDRGRGGVNADPARAAQWYAEAAAQGHADARNNLARLYAEGRGVAQSSIRAVSLWRAAARDGHTMARYNLGLALYRGEGAARDVEAALKEIRAAAEAGLAQAQYALGQMHRLGAGLPRNREAATLWYRRAATQGHPGARAALSAGGQAAPAAPADSAPGTGASRSLTDAGHTGGLGDSGLRDSGLREFGGTRGPVSRPSAAPGESAARNAPSESSAPAAMAALPRTEPQPEPRDSVPRDRIRREKAPGHARVPNVTGFQIWLGTLGSRAAARDYWHRLAQRFGRALNGLEPHFEHAADPQGDVMVRLHGGVVFTRAEAEARCRRVRQRAPHAFCQTRAVQP